MGRSAAAVADVTKRQVLDLRSTGLGYGAIASQLGVSRAYVQRICNGSLPAPKNVDHLELINTVIEVKKDKRSKGSWAILNDIAVARGLDQNDLPSEATINRATKGLCAPRVGIQPGKVRYWLEDRPSTPLEIVLIDTALVPLNGENIVIVVALDYVSRAMHAELLPKNFTAYLPWFLARTITAFGGVPRRIQSDNGIGFNPVAWGKYSPLLHFAAELGVESWEYVPIAEAQRNGRVEKANDTIKTWWYVQTFADLDAAKAGLASYLCSYNKDRWHYAISERKRGGYKTPADLLVGYDIPVVADASVIDVSRCVKPIELRFKRKVFSDGGFYLPAPKSLFFVTPDLEGHYITLVIPTDRSAASVLLPYEDSGSLQAKLVGFVDHSWMTNWKRVKYQKVFIGYVNLSDSTSYKAIPFDNMARRKAEQKHLKDVYVPGRAHGGYEWRGQSEDLALIDVLTGQVIWSAECDRLDHMDEVSQ